MVTVFFCPSTGPVFEVIIIGKNKPKAYKRIITREAIIKALTALIFIKINFHQFSCRTNEILKHVWIQKSLQEKKVSRQPLINSMIRKLILQPKFDLNTNQKQ